MIINFNKDESYAMADYIEMGQNEISTSRLLELRYISRNDINCITTYVMKNTKSAIYACQNTINIWCFIK